MNSNDFLKALTVVLCTAGVTTVIFQRLKQPVVLGYILAGLIVGPHLPIPLVADPKIVETLSEIGVILLMFSLGLEFSFRRLLRVGATAGLTALLQSSIMVWFGFMAGTAFGWTPMESLFTGAMIAISSTTIISKAFDEEGISGRLRDLVVAVLIVEDLIAILLMSLLTAVTSSQNASLDTLSIAIARLAAFLAGFVVAGVLIIPWTMRAIQRLKRPETTLVASIGICFGGALIAHELGYSVALGAFLAGSLIAETGEEKRVEALILPVRDMFAAIFFVSIGMMIDPAVLAQQWFPIVILTIVVVLGKVLSVSFGAFMTGNGIRTSIQSGMSLAQIGEFSFIIAGLGVALNAVHSFLYPVAIAVSAVTTLTTPWLIRLSGPAAAMVDRKLPRSMQTFAALYGSWIDRLRTATPDSTADLRVSRLVKLLALDSISIAVLVIVVALNFNNFAGTVSSLFGLTPQTAQWMILFCSILVSVPLLAGLVRLSQGLGVLLGEKALPGARAGTADLAAAPRRALTVSIQLGLFILATLPLFAWIQPFFPGWVVPAVFLSVFLIVSVLFWRNAQSLQGHVKAGVQVIVESLVSRLRTGENLSDRTEMQDVTRLLPGLGEPVAIRLTDDSPAVGKTLAQLEIRGLTGASVLAIVRDEKEAIPPTANVELREGDVLALAGTRESVANATILLRQPLKRGAGAGAGAGD